MANTIRIKKRAGTGSAGAPTTLAPSELAFNENSSDRKLYYGLGDDGDGTSSSVIAIGGDGAFTTLDTAQTISGNKTFTGTCDFSGATLSGNTTFDNNLTVTGNLTVSGTTTTVNSTTMTVDDKNLELGSVTTPTDTTADGGGITLKGQLITPLFGLTAPTAGTFLSTSTLHQAKSSRSMAPAFLVVALLVLALLAPALLL